MADGPTFHRFAGLAIRGLVRHHKVDPLDYDKVRQAETIQLLTGLSLPRDVALTLTVIGLQECDAALPLDSLLAPHPPLQQLIADIDRTKYRVWALTNAYVNVSLQAPFHASSPQAVNSQDAATLTGSSCGKPQHAVRVLRLTGLTDAFEGVVSCDYGAGEFTCKPEPGT